MENYSYSSYPDSVNSSPRSREIDCENASWDDPPPSNYKVKFMCSYGGKIHPRPHDNQLTYVGGETKILSVDRNIRFSSFISKVSSLGDAEVCFKYQLPGEDLDALISVTNDEDLEHMMLEYDRLCRATAKPARLRLFIFPLNSPAESAFGTGDSKSERQWFVDALNSVQIQNLEDSPSPVPPPPQTVAASESPDFLFGLDKGRPPPVAPAKPEDASPPVVPEMIIKEFQAGSDSLSEERHFVGEPVMWPGQIQDFQRLQISNEQALYNRKLEEANTRAYAGDYYHQKAPPPQTTVQVTTPAAYLPERQMTHVQAHPTAMAASEPPVYLIQTPAGVYHGPSIRTVTGQVGQAYYGLQRMVPPEIYRDQQVYSAVPPQIQHAKMGGVYSSESIGMVRPPAQAETTYGQIGFDGAGRQVYFTPPSPLHPALSSAGMALDVRQSGGLLNSEGKKL